jgi:hypothetical protein
MTEGREKMNLKEDRKVSRTPYSHSLEEVEDLLARYGFDYIKNATEFVHMNGGINKIQKLIDENTPETLQDVINDLNRSIYQSATFDPVNISALVYRLEEINKRTCDAMELEAAKDERQAKPTDQQTCPHCGSNHVITTKAITIGEGRYSEAETDLCLKCGSAW